MSRKLLVLGSIMAVGATASLLLFNQNSSRSPISTIPTLLSTSPTPTSFKKNENTLVPLLPSLAKPLTSPAELSLKESQPEPNISSQPLATPTITSVKPKPFASTTLAKSSLQKPPPIVTPTLGSPLNSRQFVSTGEAELAPKKSPPVFTHRSRPIVPPIDYPVVPTESLATPMPILEIPTPNTSREILVTPMPIAETPTLKAPLITPTPIESLATPTPTPMQSTPILTPSPN